LPKFSKSQNFCWCASTPSSCTTPKAFSSKWFLFCSVCIVKSDSSFAVLTIVCETVALHTCVQRRIFIFGALGYYKLGALLEGRSGRSHIFSLRPRSCSESVEPRYRSESAKFSNLRIRLLLRLRIPSMQSKFSNVFIYDTSYMKTRQAAENEKWLRIRIPFFTNFGFGSSTGSERKTQDPAGVDSGTPDPWLQWSKMLTVCNTAC